MKRHVLIFLTALISFLFLFGNTSTYASEPTKDPFLRIETGMHTSVTWMIGIDDRERYLVTGSDDKTVRVWELSTGRLIRVIRPPIGDGKEGKIYAVAMSPDGRTIAAAGWTGYEWDKLFCIYLFDTETGKLIKRLTGLPDVIYCLTYSRDGSFILAAGNIGIRIYRTSDYALVADYALGAKDRDYGWSSYGADFDTNGRVVTTSYDGYIRLYDRDFKLIAKKKAPGGNRPFHVRFSPDGSKVAVGFNESTKVDVLDASLKTPNSELLTHLYSPDSKDVYGDLYEVSWSSDGRFLYAGGRAQKQINGVLIFIIRKWSNEGRGRFIDIDAARDSIKHILPLKYGGIAFGAGDTSFGIIDDTDRVVISNASSIACYIGLLKNFLISHNGSMVQFGYEVFGKSPAVFSVSERILETEIASPSARSDTKLTPPITSSSGLEITDWENNYSPKLNGKPLKLAPYEPSRSLAIAPDGNRFLLGADWSLRLFDRKGKEIWNVSVSTAWAVNISGDSRLAVAAFNDGTIRWYRMTDGKELLAFFPHKDKKRWVMWTPEGFFDASEGGAELIGYHVNQGKDKEAVFIPIDKLYNAFYRPDLVTAKFQDKDISEYARNINVNQLLSEGGLPPKIKILTSSGNSDKHDITVNAEICDTGGGIGDITLFLNDIPISVGDKGRGVKIIGKASGQRQGECYSFEKLITLQNGVNVISLMAYNRNNTIESERDKVEIAYKTGQAEKSDLYILAMAVNNYRDGDLKLKYSKNDSEELIKVVQEKAETLFKDIHIHKLYDEDVNKEKIGNIFEDLGKRTKREDVFLLFVAGHGITNEKDGAYYFLPVNFRYTGEEAIMSQGVSMNDFKRYLSNIQAMKSLLLLDTCNSGSFAEAIASRGMIEKTAINKLSRAVGRATIVASSKNQVALEGYEGHGVFTYTLLEAMKGKAADKDGKITINGIAIFVEEMLPQITYKKWGYEQIPQKTLTGMDFPIAVKK